MTEAIVVPEESKRGPGRPKSEATAPAVKKGKPTWKPANVDDVFDKEAGFRYRKVNKDPRNMAKKIAEGWEILSDIAGHKTTNEVGYGRIDAGKPLTSVRESYDTVLARIPEEAAKERDAFHNAENERRVAGLHRQTKEELGSSGAPMHGSITTEKRGIRTVIKD